MATARVIEYCHAAVPPEFRAFVLAQSHLRGVDLTIAQNYLSGPELDTAGYAQLVHMDKHNFSRHSANVFRALMRVLIQMSLELWETKYRNK